MALAAALAAAAGTGVAATRGAQTTADEPQYLLSALSVAEDGNLDIADELAAQRWRAFHAAPLPEQTRPLPGATPGAVRRVSPHDPLLPLLLAGPVAVGGWVGAKLALATMGGALAGLLVWTAVTRFGVAPRVAALVVGVFAVSAPLAVYATQVYPEVPAALAVTAGVAALTGTLRRGGRWALAAAVVALPWLAVKYVPVAAALAAVGAVRLLRRGDRRPVLGLALALLAAGAVYAAVHLAVYTGVTPYAAGDHFVGGEFTAVGSTPSYLGRSRRLLGLLVDRGFGLAGWQPAWLLAVPAVAIVARRGPHRAALLAPLAAGWLTATFVALTMHGFWFPGRQVVVVLPLVVLAVAVAADRHPVLRPLVAVLGAAGLWSYAWLVAEGLGGRITWVVDFFTVGDPWYGAWARLLPDYLRTTAATELRQAGWLLAVAAGAVCGWRAAGAAGDRCRRQRGARAAVPVRPRTR